MASRASRVASWRIHTHCNGLSLKKFVVSSFWSDLQKVIGGWFDVDTFTVTMPKGKVADALAILNSDELASHQVSFELFNRLDSFVGGQTELVHLHFCSRLTRLPD